MRMPRFASFAVLLLSLCAQSAEPAASSTAPKKLTVLFIGNSLTSRNNLPGIVAAMAASQGRELAFTAQLVGGATLKKHWDDGKALAKIKEGHWDCVVLQDLSRESYVDRDAMFKYGRLFDTEVRKAGSKTVLYMTWALENDSGKFPAIVEAYSALAKDIHAQRIPAGTAWHTVTAETPPAVQLYVADHKHPTPAGSYLTACVFYRALFGTPSAGLPNKIEWKTKLLADLPQDQAAALQKIADTTDLPAVE